MDFSLTDEQQELSGLIRQILEDRMTLEHLKAIDHSDEWFDRDTWAELAKANLLGVAIPEEHGGLGFGFLEACLLLQEQGRTVAPVPLVYALVGGMAIAEHGTEEQRRALADLAAGRSLVVPALEEYGTAAEQPATRAKADGGAWRLDGVKTAVPMAHVADSLLVPAVTDEGRVAVYVVPGDAANLVLARQQTTGREPQFEVTLDGVSAHSALGDLERGPEILAWLVARMTVGYCAIVAGAARRALEITAQYTVDRKQFDRAIGTFQAVGQRMADSYIDVSAIELTMLAAASHLAEGRDVPLEVATAKFWAADGGSRVGHAALHVHGGISIDVDYAIHRYFLWIKHIENALGGATPQLVRLGRILADAPV